MFFSKKEKKPDIEEIKEAVEPQEEAREPGVYEKEVPEESAPLFVKVEKYEEILRNVREMMAFVSGIKQLFAILNEIESVRSDAIKIMRATVQRLEKDMIQIDSELLRPKGVEVGEKEPGEAELYHIEDSLSDLQKQLATLRRDLQELK